jgi:hypothetical protein
MEYSGKVLSDPPYYPVDSDDYERVSSTIEEMLLKQAGESQ